MSHPPASQTVRPRAAVWLAGTLLLIAPAAIAQEEGAAPDGPEREFLQGLRDRGLADFALLEIDRLAEDPGAPADLKAALPYERALSLLARARGGQAGSGARALLDEAAALLEDFADKNPNGPLTGDAQFLRAEILQQAAADLLGAGDPAAAAEETKTRARRLLEDAERVYASARASLERTLREIGPFVEQRDDAGRARRNRAEGRLILARVEGARAIFRRAQTHPVGSAERDRLLDQADAPLTELMNDFRRKIGALPGRIIQAQINVARVPEDPAAVEALSADERAEAKKQLTTAAATLGEVLDQQAPADAGAAVRDAVEALRGTAQRLRLSVLNHPLKADHATVITQATEWLDGDRARGGTPSGAGVLFERGIARERAAPAEEGRERTLALRAALADFETAARRNEQVRGPATLAADRVRQALGLDREEPTKFADAYDAAQPLVRQIGEKQDAVKAAKTEEERVDARGDLDAVLSEAVRLLTAATDLADGNTDAGELSRARYLLAFVNVQSERYYEAAVLAEYVARYFEPPPPDPEKPDAPDQSGLPEDAAQIAAIAWTNAYTNRPEGTDGAFELRQLDRVANFIAEKFPGSELVSSVRVTLGTALLREGRYERAAEAFASVPESAATYAVAQLLAGDALWRRRNEIARLPLPPAGADPDALQQRAKEFLRTGVAKSEAALSQDAEPSAQLVAAKVTLAQILNGEGEYQAAVDLLTGGKAPITDAVAVEKDEKRPDRGVKSAAFAGQALTALLRAQIGLKQIDPAMETMAALEASGAGDNTRVFVDLGRSIEEELEALPPGPDRDATLTGFEEFLGEIAKLKEQTFSSRLWVAETYNSLAAALPAGDGRRTGYLTKAAAALRGILGELGTDGFLPGGTDRESAERGVRLRLAEVLAGSGKFEEGYAEIRQVIAGKTNALNAQTVAADLLAGWGEDTGDGAKLAQALAGDGDVWGWGQLSRMLAAQLIGPNADAFQPQYNAARLRIPEVRAALAETKSGEERKEEYAKAEKELLSWITLTDPGKIAPETRRDAEDLYLRLQEGRGVADPKPLPDDVVAPKPAGGTDAEAPKLAGADGAPAPKAASAGELTQDGPPVILLVAGLILFGLATVGAIFAFRPKKRKRAARRSTGKKAAAGETAKAPKGKSVVQSAMPDLAPIPAAVPVAVDDGPTGTDFPDFSALPKKRSSDPSAAPRTRSRSSSGSAGSSSGSGRTRRSGSSSSSSSSSGSGKRPSGGSADGKQVRRRSSSGSSSSGSKSSGSSSSGSGSSGSGLSETPRKRRPKPPSE